MAQLDFKGWLSAGVVGGMLWGFVAFAVNSVTGVFAFEGALVSNAVSFVVAGGVLGGVTGGLLVVTVGLLSGFPLMKSDVAKAVFVATALWLLLRITGFALTMADPERYTPKWDEAAQGLVLVFLLGAIIGYLRGVLKEKFFK